MVKNSDKVTDASDCCVGSIVWVRRRNGSWWPGKILGSDGLSASNLMSPRSGTPVKLLGREDASVDWYNLEKSKRVKAFRCGEFDDCIQKVEASLGLPPKKREKYARREDAILHALELEKETMEKKYVKMEPVCNEAGCELSDDEKKKSIVPSEKLLRSRSRSEKQDLNVGDRFGSKGNNTITTPGTRNGLALGFQTNPAKRKLTSSFVADGSKKIETDDPVVRNSQRKRDRCLSPVPERQKKRKYLTTKANRGPSSNLGGKCGDLLNNDDHGSQKPISSSSSSQIMEGNYGLAGFSKEAAASVSAEDDTETDTVGTKSLGLETDEDTAGLSDDVQEWQHRSTNNNNNEQAELASGGEERSISTPACMDGISKWKFKGKRKVRVRGGNNLSKVSFPRRGEDLGPEDSVTAKTMLLNNDTDGNNDDDDVIDWEESSWNEFLPSYGGGGYYCADHHHHPSSSRSYLLEHDSCRRLIDIELKVVQAATSNSNQRKHVPLISLLSKLNGHAIIGHSILVEPLENGSSETLLLSSSQANDETTNFRVPPPRPSATKKLSRKVQKKIRLSSSSSQKIKTLSSIGTGLKKINGKEEEEKRFIKGGVLTGVACIPVKLVFSRLHEELVGLKLKPPN